MRSALWDIGGEAGPGSWDRVCAACTEALSVTGAAISLLSGDQRTSLGTSDDVAGTIEEAHFTLGEGPGVDAARLGVAVHEPDLAAAGPTRWPMFAAQALGAGVAAVDALPLQAGTVHIGTMDLYRDRTGPLTAPQLADALTVAALVTHSVSPSKATPPGPSPPRWPRSPSGGSSPGHRHDRRPTRHRRHGRLARLRSHAYATTALSTTSPPRSMARTLRFDDQTDQPSGAPTGAVDCGEDVGEGWVMVSSWAG